MNASATEKDIFLKQSVSDKFSPLSSDSVHRMGDGIYIVYLKGKRGLAKSFGADLLVLIDIKFDHIEAVLPFGYIRGDSVDYSKVKIWKTKEKNITRYYCVNNGDVYLLNVDAKELKHLKDELFCFDGKFLFDLEDGLPRAVINLSGTVHCPSQVSKIPGINQYLYISTKVSTGGQKAYLLDSRGRLLSEVEV